MLRESHDRFHQFTEKKIRKIDDDKETTEELLKLKRKKSECFEEVAKKELELIETRIQNERARNVREQEAHEAYMEWITVHISKAKD